MARPESKGGKPVLGSYSNDPFGRGPWEKVVFGTDVDPQKVAEVKGDYDRLVKKIKLNKKDRTALFGGTAAKILGLA